MLSKALEEIGSKESYFCSAYRIVETQEYAATTELVDNLDEQHLLEEMLDEVKPPYPEFSEQLHYLISTPFRYPPLLHGSRFGNITMASYFYASENVDTMLAECAYYRFAFLKGMAVPYEKKAITSEHMSFSVSIKSNAMADLTKIKSRKITEAITSKDNYLFSQQLGRLLIEQNGFDVIRFQSARDADRGANVAVKSPDQIASKQPKKTVNWLCHTTNERISFTSYGTRPVSFDLSYFSIDGVLPRPA